MKIKVTPLIAFFLSAFLLLTTTAVASSELNIRIGSKRDAESQLLAEIMAQLIEAKTDYRVTRCFGLGGTMMTFQALLHNEIDLYPEASGTAWYTLLKQGPSEHNPLAIFTRSQALLQQNYQLAALAPFGFSNSYGLAILKTTAERANIHTISALAAHPHSFTAGFSHEFINREDGLGPLKQQYGLDFKKIFGIEHGLAYQALMTGQAEVIEVWSTDGKLAKYPVLLLDDDQNHFPPYHAFPLLSNQILAKASDLRPVLSLLSFTLTNETMQRLNYAVEEEHKSLENVAHQFLQSLNLVNSDNAPRQQTLIAQYQHLLPQFIAQHLKLVLLSMLAAILVGVPVGILIAQKRQFSSPILALAGLIQTIPSLALLALLIAIPAFGLGARSATTALFLYALLPIIRATFTGIKQIEPALIESATGLGLSPRQTLLYIKVPLVVSPIMSGIRTATVINIGIATIAAFIGAGGLGEPILTGLQLNDPWLILLGAIPAGLLAILTDFLLSRLECLLTPTGLLKQARHYHYV